MLTPYEKSGLVRALEANDKSEPEKIEHVFFMFAAAFIGVLGKHTHGDRNAVEFYKMVGDAAQRWADGMLYTSRELQRSDPRRTVKEQSLLSGLEDYSDIEKQWNLEERDATEFEQ